VAERLEGDLDRAGLDDFELCLSSSDGKTVGNVLALERPPSEDAPVAKLAKLCSTAPCFSTSGGNSRLEVLNSLMSIPAGRERGISPSSLNLKTVFVDLRCPESSCAASQSLAVICVPLKGTVVFVDLTDVVIVYICDEIRCL